MNSQSRIDRQVAALHAAIAARIRSGDSSPLERAGQNLQRWRERFGGVLPIAYIEWVELLGGGDTGRILDVMLSDSEDAVRRRSNSPFTGVLSTAERLEIMRRAA
jgi:hypothetical protein